MKMWGRAIHVVEVNQNAIDSMHQAQTSAHRVAAHKDGVLDGDLVAGRLYKDGAASTLCVVSSSTMVDVGR